MKARIERASVPRMGRLRSGDSARHLSMLRQLCCAVYQTPGPSDPHHLMRIDSASRGMALRNADRYAIPLSRKAHDELHASKLGEEDFLASKGVDGRGLALALWTQRDGELADYQRIMDRHAQRMRLNAREPFVGAKT